MTGSLPASAAIEAAREFLAWWQGEMLALVPLRLRVVLSGGAPMEVLYGREGFLLPPGADAAASRGLPAPLRDGEALAALRAARRGGETARLVLAESVCLVRETVVPAAAVGRAGDLLALELERIAPFRRDAVCFGWRVGDTDAGHGTVLVQAIAKRAVLGAAAEALFQAGFRRVRAFCRLADGAEIALPLPPELARRAPRFSLAALNRLSTIVLIGAAFSLVAVAFARQHGALAVLADEIGSVERQAAAVRATYDEARLAGEAIAALRARAADAPGALRILEEVTRVLPDTAWITDLRIEGQKVTAMGFAQSAPGLIAAIEASELFTKAEFISPVVRAPREEADRFSISFEAGRGAGASPGQPAE